eukprot:4823620-Lingulodinium_polyedra.AAC.1
MTASVCGVFEIARNDAIGLTGCGRNGSQIARSRAPRARQKTGARGRATLEPLWQRTVDAIASLRN